MAPPAAAKVVKLTPAYNLTFLVVVALTFLSMCACIALALLPQDLKSDDTRELIGTFSTILKTGFGAIVGLLGGKTLN